jgi:hypothetical protein
MKFIRILCTDAKYLLPKLYSRWPYLFNYVFVTYITTLSVTRTKALNFTMVMNKLKLKLRGFDTRAKYTDRATAASWQS